MWNLLVVDDDDERRERIVRAAEKVQFHKNDITQTRSGSQARHQIDESGQDFDFAVIDIVLTDLPEKEGLDVIHLLRTKNPSCKIIALTGMGGTEFGIEAMRAGADDFISTQWEHVNWYSLLMHRLSLWRGVAGDLRVSER